MVLIGHIVPEAAAGGPIAFVKNGDEIVIDAENNILDLLVDESVLAERRKGWTPPSLDTPAVLCPSTPAWFLMPARVVSPIPPLPPSNKCLISY